MSEEKSDIPAGMAAARIVAEKFGVMPDAQHLAPMYLFVQSLCAIVGGIKLSPEYNEKEVNDAYVMIGQITAAIYGLGIESTKLIKDRKSIPEFTSDNTIGTVLIKNGFEAAKMLENIKGMLEQAFGEKRKLDPDTDIPDGVSIHFVDTSTGKSETLKEFLENIRQEEQKDDENWLDNLESKLNEN